MKKSGKINYHVFGMGVLCFILTLIVSEIIVYVVQRLTGNMLNETYAIMMYIIPSFTIVLTSLIIYITHRTLGVSQTLITALNEISDGNYDVVLPYKRLDGFNAVYKDFNKMAKELKSVRALREDFVHDFSHEFKTPIASINGFANLLLEGNLTEEEVTQILKIIAAESERLSRLSESVLLLSKIENQQFIGETKKFRIDEQLRDCVILLENQWKEKKISIETDLKEINYLGDASLMRQVWLNLISNAIKYTPEGGEIRVSAGVSGGKTRVEVKDNGVGISEEDLPKIFEKYYQGSNCKHGNGLGLAICKRICDMCGAEISVVSKEGEGSAFTVVL